MTRPTRRDWVIALGTEGALVASALWIVAVLLPFSGEPTVSPSATDRLIGAGVAAALGSIGATVLARITR